MNINDIIKRIWHFRNVKNISARELSLKIDRNESYISKLESKDFNLPTSMLLEIIDALGVTPAEFFAENYMTYTTDNELYSLVKNLPQSKKESLIDFIKR